MINIEHIKSRTQLLAEGHMDRFVDPTLRLQDHTTQSCPGTEFTKLMVDCMRREPRMPGS